MFKYKVVIKTNSLILEDVINDVNNHKLYIFVTIFRNVSYFYKENF